MKCTICGREAQSGLVHLGAYCSDVHRDRLVERAEATYRALLEESIETMPDVFTTEEFDRYVLKFAVHGLHALTTEAKAAFERSQPHLLDPHASALAMKARLLAHIPSCYLEIEELRGIQRLTLSGTFRFREPVPQGVVLEAFEKAGLLK